MAQNSNIEWTDTTWNPLAGCTRVSSGCDACYAAKMSLRLEAMALADIEAGKDPGGKRKYIGIATKNGKGVPAFNGKINLDYGELERPYSWKKPRRVFVNSMSDLFHQDVPERFILDSFNVMKDSPQHTFQVLTKRPDRMADFSLRYGVGLPPNVWAGTSVENQETADLRIPNLLRVKAAVRFLSCEPLLGPVLLDDGCNSWLTCNDPRPEYTDDDIEDDCCESYMVGGSHFHGIDWVIAGGESGPHARPCHPDWIRSLRDQCQVAGVAFHFKQWGEWLPGTAIIDEPINWKAEISEYYPFGYVGNSYKNGPPYHIMCSKRVGKKAAGRLLDGREWNEFPLAAEKEPQ